MNALGDHPNKPRSACCRRAALQKWTGWTDEMIDDLVAIGAIRTYRLPKPNCKRPRLHYLVDSVQEILDGK